MVVTAQVGAQLRRRGWYGKGALSSLPAVLGMRCGQSAWVLGERAEEFAAMLPAGRFTLLRGACATTGPRARCKSGAGDSSRPGGPQPALSPTPLPASPGEARQQARSESSRGPPLAPTLRRPAIRAQRPSRGLKTAANLRASSSQPMPGALLRTARFRLPQARSPFARNEKGGRSAWHAESGARRLSVRKRKKGKPNELQRAARRADPHPVPMRTGLYPGPASSALARGFG